MLIINWNAYMFTSSVNHWPVIWLLDVNFGLLCKKLGESVKIDVPSWGASINGLFVRLLQHLHTFTVKVNGALMMRSRFIIRSGRCKEVW